MPCSRVNMPVDYSFICSFQFLEFVKGATSFCSTLPKTHPIPSAHTFHPMFFVSFWYCALLPTSSLCSNYCNMSLHFTASFVGSVFSILYWFISTIGLAEWLTHEVLRSTFASNMLFTPVSRVTRKRRQNIKQSREDQFICLTRFSFVFPFH